MTTKSGAVAKVVEAFDTFREAYDQYVQAVDTALPSEVEDDALRERIASIVIGSGDVGIYLRDYGYTIDSMRHLPRQ
ncbi:hypothetical protein [Rhizobium leguminosarum]|uniref:hypothetical protein n=1 Tax=Rhizobium leguminosarum TaxID=384 RepID=UPI0010301ED3|nr:hypothetical protein [Rhizobium leguminosarum]TAV90463.1 hypothetical protein ELI22_15065 [Rhizobium leguminosarum]TAV95068.1 hypothetical protein ELI21_15220 [Rhizobium leguminosarum]TAW36146.1 hypothetical protein ELI23_15265 [Rhizobium leguminosarum]